MKKSSLLVCVIIVFLILSGCSNSKAKGEHESFLKLDDKGNYTGFLYLPDDYTPEKALKDGCFVVTKDSEKKDSSKLYGGKEHWDTFLDASSKGEEAFIRAVTFLPEGIFYDDLYYSNGQYHNFYYDRNSLSDTLKDRPYKYLRTLTDKFGIPPKDSTIYVLTDSLELTFHDVMWSMLSSSIASRTKIPFHWISFTTYIK
ncbi:MAG: hypothetical protein K0R09_3060 [Clostridiales bacterium]|jgi:hypothetical protein|nr:hypothetical protein [Clostridiales bacterium]